MNLLLAIDTSQGTAVALLRNEVLLAEFYEPNTMLHAEQIGPLIEKVLGQANCTAKDVSAVAVGEGPAPFTGLRVGIAAAKLFARGSGAKLFGVSSLDAVAFDLDLSFPTLVITDARRGEVYFALYKGKNSSGVPIRVGGPGVEKLADLENRLAAEKVEYRLVHGSVSASSLGKLANSLILGGQLSEGARANYLRAPDAIASAAKKVSG